MGIESKYNITVDFKTPKNSIVNIKQWNKGLQNIYIKCTDDGVPVKLNKESMKAIIKLRKPDNRQVIDTCEITDDGQIKLTVTETITQKAGRCFAEIVLLEIGTVSSDDYTSMDALTSGNSIATMDICINIYPSPLLNKDVESTDDFNGLYVLMSKAIRDYLWIMNETKGLIGSVKTINGRAPDDDGAFEFNADDYQPLINQTLSTAKESGAFDGKDGKDGANGSDGKTPKKFVDYFTEADLAELGMVSTVCGKRPSSGTRNVALTCADIGAVSTSKFDACFKLSDDGSMDMNGKQLKNIGEPASAKDAATKGYIDKKMGSLLFQTNAVIPVGEWIGESTYVKTISVTGVTKGMSLHIMPDYSSVDDVESVIDSWQSIYRAVSGNDTITFYATGAKPDAEIPIFIEAITC